MAFCRRTCGASFARTLLFFRPDCQSGARVEPRLLAAVGAEAGGGELFPAAGLAGVPRGGADGLPERTTHVFLPVGCPERVVRRVRCWANRLTPGKLEARALGRVSSSGMVVLSTGKNSVSHSIHCRNRDCLCPPKRDRNNSLLHGSGNHKMIFILTRQYITKADPCQVAKALY